MMLSTLKLIKLYGDRFVELESKCKSHDEISPDLLAEISLVMHKFVSWYGVATPSLVGQQACESAIFLVGLLKNEKVFQNLYLHMMYQNKGFSELQYMKLKKAMEGENS